MEKKMNLEEFKKTVSFLFENGCKLDDPNVFKFNEECGSIDICIDSVTLECSANFSKTYKKCNKNKDYSLKFEAFFLGVYDEETQEMGFIWNVGWIGAYCENIEKCDCADAFLDSDEDAHIAICKQLSDLDDIKSCFSMYDLLVQVVKKGCLYKKPTIDF